MSALHFVVPRPGKLSLEELMAELGPEHFRAIDATARMMREKYECPLRVPDYEAFKDAIFDFFALYEKTFFNADYTKVANRTFARGFAYEFAQKHLTAYNPSLKQQHARDMRVLERNAIEGRNGGLPKILDNFTEAIIRLHTETRIRAVFIDLIAPSDYQTRLRLADEFIKKYGGTLFPGEQLLPHWIVGMDLEEFIGDFIGRINEMRQHWQY